MGRGAGAGGGYGSPTNFADPTGLQSLGTPQGQAAYIKLFLRERIENAIEMGVEYGIENVKSGVYIIEGADGRVYVGQSEDIDRRLREHGARFGPSAATAIRLPVPSALRGRSTRESREFFEQLVLDHYREQGRSVANLRNPVGPKRSGRHRQSILDWLRCLVRP